LKASTIALAAAVLALSAVAPLCAQTTTASPTAAVAFDLPSTEPRDPAAAPMTLSAPDIHIGKPIPQTYAVSGKDISPKLNWSAGPAGTKSYVLLVEDPDGGGATPSRTQAVKSLSKARMVQDCGLGLDCCWQTGGWAGSGSGAGECCVLAIM